LPDLRLETDWDGNPPGTNGLAFDARFERYAWSFNDEGIRVRRLADHADLVRLPVPPSDRVSRWVRMRFSPDGRYLAAWFRTWGAQRTLQVWDLQADQFTTPRVNLEEAATQAEFSTDARTVVVGLSDGAVVAIDLETQNAQRLAPGWPPDQLALHADGRLLAVASAAKHGVQLRDLQTRQVLRELPHPAGVQAVAWQPNGSLLAAGCDDFRIRLWDSASGQERGALEGHWWELSDLAFDPSGAWLMSFGWDYSLAVWDVGFGRQVLSLQDVRVLNFGAQGVMKAACLTGRRVHVWSFHPSDVHHVLHGHQKQITHCEFSPDSRWLASSAVGGNVRLWDVTARRQVGCLPEQVVAHWGAQGEYLLTVASDRLLRWPVRSLGPGGAAGIQVGPPREVPQFGITLGTLRFDTAWSGHGQRRLVVADGERGRVHLLEIGDVCCEKWQALVPRANHATASADGRWVAVSPYEGSSQGVRVWQADTGRLEKELAIGDAQVQFSPDSRWLYTVTGRLSPRGAELCAWRVGTWEPAHHLPLLRTISTPPVRLGIAPDGSAVAAPYSQETVRLVRAESFAEIATLTAPEPGLIVATYISPDGALLLTKTGARLHLWDLRRLRRELKALGLDWDLAEYPPAPPANAQPLQVVIQNEE
jgi:WD40 repeat protein